MGDTTRIREADWVIAWDDQAERQIFLRQADVVFSGDSLTHVGAGHDGDADVEIDGGGLMVMPGLVDIHSHPGDEPKSKGLFEETGSPLFHNTGLIEYMPLVRGDPETCNAGLEFALCELLKSGCTTICDLSGAREGWLDILAVSGIRAYAAPMFRSARWYTPNGHELCYEWTEDGGRQAFDEALAVVNAAEAHPCGRLKGMISPSQVDTCTPELLKRSAAAARGVAANLSGVQLQGSDLVGSVEGALEDAGIGAALLELETLPIRLTHTPTRDRLCAHNG